MTIRELMIGIGFDVSKSSEKRVNDSIQSIKATATKALGAIGIGFSLVALNNIAEEFNSIGDKIRDATRDMVDQAGIQKTILKGANDARQSYGDMADTVSKLVKNTEIFSGVEDASEFAGLLYKNFMATGKSAKESHSIVQQMTTSISRGVVDSRAMMVLFRESPATLRMLADSLGVTTDALQEMVSKGQVSAATLKNVFEKNAGKIDDRFNDLDFSISDAFTNIRNEWGVFVNDMNSTLGITQSIARFMVKGFSKVMAILRRAQDMFVKIGNRIGGVDKLTKALAISAGAVFFALNAGKILAFLRTISTLFGIINLKVLALIAVFVVIALLVEDFIAFMQGKKSLLGEMFQKAGIDAEAFRNKVIRVWNNIKTATMAAWNKIKGWLLSFWESIKEWWNTSGEELYLGIVRIFNGILDFIDGVFTGKWKEAFSGIVGIVEGAIDSLYAVFGPWLAVLGGAAAVLVAYKIAMLAVVAAHKAGMIVAALSKAWAAFNVALQMYRNGATLAATAQWLLNTAMLANPIGLIILAVIGLVAAFVILWKKCEGFRNFFIGMWEGIKIFFSALWIGIKDIVSSVIDWFKKNWMAAVLFVINPFAGLFKYLYDNFEGFRNFVDGIVQSVAGFFRWLWDGMLSGFDAVVDFFKGAVSAIVGFFQPLIDIIGNVTEFISGGFGKAVNLVKGIFGGGKDKVGDTTITDMAALSMTPRPDTVSTAVSPVENKSIVQNIEISNTFNGDRAGQRKSSEAMGNAADDITGELSRALAYAR